MSLLRFGHSGGRYGIHPTGYRLILTGLLLSLLAPAVVRAQAVRTQALTLAAGWNAVYLEVDPLEQDPALLLAETPIDVVAAFSKLLLDTLPLFYFLLQR